jgi:hypothetical protein
VAGVPSHEKYGGLGKSPEIFHDITNDERFSSAPNPKGYMGIMIIFRHRVGLLYPHSQTDPKMFSAIQGEVTQTTAYDLQKYA